MQTVSEAPYQLGASSDGNLILAHGPEDMLVYLLRLSGARLFQRKSDGTTAAVPATRANFMAAEAVAAPVRVSERYRELRQMHMGECCGHPYDPLLAKDLREPLLPHQEEFLAVCAGQSAVLNASEQGTGKTRAALATLAMKGCRRTLIVCPKSLAQQWKREWEEMWTKKPDCQQMFTLATDGPIKNRALLIADLNPVNLSTTLALANQVLVVNYEALWTLRKWLDAWQSDAIVIDEGWRIKSPRAICTKAAIWLADQMRARRGRDDRPWLVMDLTGTPVGNDVGDLWAQLRFLDPTLVPKSYSAFLGQYAVMRPLHLGARIVQKPCGISDPAGLMVALEPVWFRATKATCLQLPPKRYEVVRLKPTPEVAALYRAVKKDGESVLAGDTPILPSAVVKALRLQQITGGHVPSADSPPWQIPCAKIEWLREWAQEVLAPHPQTRAIIWCRFNAEIERISDMLDGLLPGRVEDVTGATPDKRLNEVKASFNARDVAGTQVIVAQIQKLAAGHNLQAADWHIYFSNNWSFLLRDQSEDRSHRLGRHDAVQYVDLLLQSTIDEDIYAALQSKSDFASRLTPETVTAT